MVNRARPYEPWNDPSSFWPGDEVIFIDANNEARVGTVDEQFKENGVVRVRIRTLRGTVSPDFARVGHLGPEFRDGKFAFPKIV